MIAVVLIGISLTAYLIYLAYQYEIRVLRFEKLSAENDETYYERADQFYERLAGRGHKLFTIRHNGRRRARIWHLLEVPFKHGWMAVFEYSYDKGPSGDRDHHHHAVAIESDVLPVTQFTIMRKRLIHHLGFMDSTVDIEMSPAFSKRFFLSGENEAAVRSAFSDEVIHWFEHTDSSYNVELKNGGLILYAKGRLRPEAVETLKQDGRRLHDLLSRSINAGKFDTGWGDEHDW